MDGGKVARGEAHHHRTRPFADLEAGTHRARQAPEVVIIAQANGAKKDLLAAME